jgi:hypothetical protein
LKVARRIGLIALAGLCVFFMDRTGWPLYSMLGVWVVLLVLGALVAERRGYPKPLQDFMIFGLLAVTATALALQGAQFLWNREFGGAAVFAVFILILVKATMDFLERPLPGEKKTSVVLGSAGKPLTEPRHEII